MSDSKRMAMILLIAVVVVVSVFSVVVGPRFIVSSAENVTRTATYEGVYARVGNPVLNELIAPVVSNNCIYKHKYKTIPMSESWVKSLLRSGFLSTEELERIQAELEAKDFVSCATAFELTRDISVRTLRAEEAARNN
ncbi:MAG: hypothetical protein CTY12_02180 [Methylotenera sp.]|nr:MAG: hypothetical protein CTY12_02180 [Methylotenera sp.]